jgi:tRNA(Ile)-lysidine synthase TilS/MesJ
MRKPDKYIASVEREVGKCINRYSLVLENDRILVGLSGGKDSLVLLETLARRRKRLPVDYHVAAAYIHLKGIGYESDRIFMESFCNDLNVPFKIIDVETDLTGTEDKSICFLCSWHRRKQLFDIADAENFNKIALGHHMDDAAETLLMNMFFSGSMSSMPPALELFSGKIKLIRPLLMLSEEKIAEYAKIRNFPVQKKICPYSGGSQRAKMKAIIDQIKKSDKNAAANIYNSMSNIHREYLPPEIK